MNCKMAQGGSFDYCSGKNQLALRQEEKTRTNKTLVFRVRVFSVSSGAFQDKLQNGVTDPSFLCIQTCIFSKLTRCSFFFFFQFWPAFFMLFLLLQMICGSLKIHFKKFTKIKIKCGFCVYINPLKRMFYRMFFSKILCQKFQNTKFLVFQNTAFSYQQ